MARTKKQTLENASERKRLIQEEILRESLAAKQKTAVSAVGTSPSTASPPARARAKGKHRPRHAQSSPNEVASHASPTSAHSGTPVATGVSSSRRRKAEAHREFSKSIDSTQTELVSGQDTLMSRISELKKAAEESPSNKGDMPKAVLCIPDIYSRPSNSSTGDFGCKSQGMEKTPEAAPDPGIMSSKASLGVKKELGVNFDLGKQKSKRELQDSVKASLKSLKAASELVREEKRRTSRKRSPGSSKEESHGSQNPSPERRSPRRQSPSNSLDSVEQQQQLLTTRKKTGKQKARLEERPKINIFTDNIGVELGKRVRSPRRLSEDMIALPIFSARRWSSSPREVSYIAEKSDGDASSAKSSLDDSESFKPPHAVSPNPLVFKGCGSVSSKKKNSFNDKDHSLSSSISDNGDKEDNTPARKVRASNLKSNLGPLTSEANGSSDSIDGVICQIAQAKKPCDEFESCKTKQNKSLSKSEVYVDCDMSKPKGFLKDEEKKMGLESGKQLKEEKQEACYLNSEESSIEQSALLNVKNTISGKNSGDQEDDWDSDDKHTPENLSVKSTEIITADEQCENIKDVREEINLSLEFSSKLEEKMKIEKSGAMLLKKKAKYSKLQSEAVGEEVVRTDIYQMDSPEKNEDSPKHEESAQKSPNKKSKGKSLVKTASGEKRKKQREKMKIGDEVLTSICRDIMSGVVITPGDSQEDGVLTKSVKASPIGPDLNQSCPKESVDSPKSQCSSNTPVALSPTTGFLNLGMISTGMSIQRNSTASSNMGLLHPAKNIILSTQPSGNTAPTTSIIATTSSTTSPSTFASAKQSSSPHITSSCSSHADSVTPSLSVGSEKFARPVFEHQNSKALAATPDLTTAKCSPDLTTKCVSSPMADKPVLAFEQRETTGQVMPHETVTKHSISKTAVTDLNQTDSTRAEKSPEQKVKRKNISDLQEEKLGLSDVSNVLERKTIHGRVSSIISSKVNEEIRESQISSKVPQPKSGMGNTEPILLSSVKSEQAKSVMQANCAAVQETRRALCTSLPQMPSKDSPQSSLLCAMLVGGSEVAHTYEKSKPVVGGAPLNLETSNVPTPRILGSPVSEQHSPSSPTVPLSEGKECSKQHSTGEKILDEEKSESNAKIVERVDDSNCEHLSEKGDALSLDVLEAASSTGTLGSSNGLREDLKQNLNITVKKDLKIDILSKLKGLDETVLKLLDIDSEEAFLGDKLMESKDLNEIKDEWPLSAAPKDCSLESLENTQPDAGRGENLKVSADLELKSEKEEETSLYGVIANLAERLKDKALSVGVEEMLSSCPKHKLKVCSQADEAARWNTLKLRLKEESKESKSLVSIKADEALLETKPIPPNLNLTEANCHDCGESMLTDNEMDDKRTSAKPCDEKSGDISPQMTNSSSTNNSLCDLDPEAMTSAIKEACMEVSTENMEYDMKERKEEIIKSLSSQFPDPISIESPAKPLIQKSKTFELPLPEPNENQPMSLQRVNSNPQLIAESFLEITVTPESLLERFKSNDQHVKSKLGSKIPVPGTSYASKSLKKTWRTPRIILQPKPLTVLSELEESSASEKNIFTCPNLQKYLNVPSNRVIVPPLKKREMQILDERAQKDAEDRAGGMAERSDKERAEEMINLEYLKYEPDFDEIDGLLFMSFSCEAELTAHGRVEKVLEWDKDDTMLRISQAKAFEEAKQLKAGMETVKFKHLRGQHMRWKKYRRLYSSEVKSILNGTSSSVEEHLRREAASKASSRKTSDISKIKNWRSKTGIARQQLEISRQKARERRRARKEKLQKAKLSASMPSSTPPLSPYPSPPDLIAPKLSPDMSYTDAVASDQLTPQLNKSGLESGTEMDNIFITRSKRRTGFSHQKEHRQLFKELNMDWEDRMIHRKLGGWSLKGNRPKAFSQAAHRREEKQKMLLSEEGSSSILILTDANPSNSVETFSPDTSTTPSRVTSAGEISSPPKDDVESQKKKKPMKLFYPLLSERMVRNALIALINLGGAKSGQHDDDVDGNGAGCPRSSRRKSRQKHLMDDLPSLRPILPCPARANVSPMVQTDAADIIPVSLCTNSQKCEADIDQVTPSKSSLAATLGSPALSDFSKSNNTITSSSSLAANVNSSVPSSPTPPASQLSSAANTPTTSVASIDIKEDTMVMEGVDTQADVVSSPSIADTASTKSCGKPGCRYGCICHLCSVSEAPAPSTSPISSSLASSCDKEYCRLGCICDSLDSERPIPEASHCGLPSCMLDCVCSSKTRKDRESERGETTIGHNVTEHLNRRKAKGKRNRNKDNDIDSIPYLPSMKRRPKPTDRFSNLPQRQKTHRSAKNLDAITRKAMMLYETSEIYCEKTERPPRRDQKDVALGLSGAPIDENFSFFTSSMATPVIEIDYPPEEESGMLFDGGATATAADKRQKKQPGLIGASSYFADLNCTADPDNYESADLEDDSQLGLATKYEDYMAIRHEEDLTFEGERPTLAVWEQSTHKRKRKSHPLSGEIFTLSTCARTQPYNYKRKQRELGKSNTMVDTVTSNLMRLAPVQAYSHSERGNGQSAVSLQSVLTKCSSVAASSSSEVLPAVSEASVAPQILTQPQVSPQITPKSVQQIPMPASTYNTNSRRMGSVEETGRNRYQQPWHTSMVCLKARGPPPKIKSDALQSTLGDEGEEEDVKEEDEVKLLEFLANCNWEGARKEILGKVAQCLTRGQYPQPRTMNICEFLVEILPKAHKPSVIPEELRKKLPGKMYSIRVRVTRREILPRPLSDVDSQVIDLSESSPVKTYPGVACSTPIIVQTSSQQRALTVSGMSHLSTNVGISGLSRLCVTSKNDFSISQLKSASAPNSRRTSTEITTAAPLTDPSIQVKKKSVSRQANLNLASEESSQAGLENGKGFVYSSISLTSPSDPTATISANVIGTSCTPSISTLPYVSSTKPLQGAKTHKLRPFGNINPSARSLLTSSSISSFASEATSTAGTMPLVCSVKTNDLKYMKIKNKDGLVQIVGMNNMNNKALVTMPLSVGQKLAAGDQHLHGTSNTCTVPFITVPVCGPGGHKVVPLIPAPFTTQVKIGTSSSAISSNSFSTSHHPILLRFPQTTQAYPHAIVKNSVLLRPVVSQQPTGKFQPLLIPSPKSLLTIAPTIAPTSASTSASKNKTGSYSSNVHAVQKQPLAPTTSCNIKPKGVNSNDEMILTFDAAVLKKKKVLKHLTTEASQKSPSNVEKQQQPGLPSTMLVTPSVVGPIMSSEESISSQKDSQAQDQISPSFEDKYAERSSQEEGKETKPSDKVSQEEDAGTSTKLTQQKEELMKSSQKISSLAAKMSESRQHVQYGPNVYVPNTKEDTSTLIMVYPPANVLTNTNPKNNSVVQGIQDGERNSIVVRTSDVSISSTSSIVSESSQGTLSQNALTSMSTHSISSVSSSKSQANLTTELNSPPSAASSQQPDGPSPSPSPLQPSLVSPPSIPWTSSQLEPCKQGVKRKLGDGDNSEESVCPSGSKSQLLAHPDAQRQIPQLDEEQDSNSSSMTAGMGLSLANPALSTTLSAINERPISSTSTSLSTGSSDNLLIMLSSDESEIDVGETEDPKAIMAMRENAERALENDHGYQRMASSDSTSPILVDEKGAKGLKVKIIKRKDMYPSEHNMRERIRRSMLKELFLELQRNVCSVTGDKYDPNLSRVNTLKQAKTTIVRLTEKDRVGQQTVKSELLKKDMLLNQRDILYDELSKTMEPDAIRNIAERAVRSCKKRRAAQAMEAFKLHQAQYHDSYKRHRSSHTDAKSIFGRSHHKHKDNSSQQTNLPRNQSSSLTEAEKLQATCVQQPISSQSTEKVSMDSVNLSDLSPHDDIHIKDNVQGNLSLNEPDDAVDLISSSSSGEVDQGNGEAYRASPSPAMYEDISDPEEETVARQAQTSLEANVATSSKTESLVMPQSLQCYEDISDVDESKLPKYEDISDSEEAVVIP